MALRIRLAAGLLLACAAWASAQDRLPESEPAWRQLTQQGDALQSRGEFREALEVLQRAHDMARSLFGEEHHNYGIALRRLAGVHRDLQEYGHAEPLYRRSLAIFEKLYGADHIEVAKALNNVGILHEELARYAQAEAVLLRAVEVAERLHEPADEILSVALYNLGNLYLSTGAYGRAEAIYRRCLGLIEGAAKPDELALGNVLSNLAKAHEYRGDYETATPMLHRALNLVESQLGPDHPRVGAALNNLATMWMGRGDFDQAEPLFRRALIIQERALGGDSLDVAAILTNLGHVLHNKGRRLEARALHERSLAILDGQSGIDHAGRGIVLRHLGDLHRDDGDLVRAEQFYGQSLATLERFLDPKNPDVPDLLTELAAIAWSQGRMHEALPLVERSAAVHEHNLQLAMSAGDERQKRIYSDRLQSGTDVVLSLHLHGALHDAAAARLAATTVLRRKGRVLEAMTDALGLVRRRVTAGDQALLDQLRAVHAERAQLMFSTLDAGQRAYKAAHQIQDARAHDAHLDRQQRELEARISARGAELGAAGRPVELNDVLAALPTDAALVEWIAYRPFDPREGHAGKRLGALRYAAYVMRRHGEVRGVDLGEARVIDELAARFRHSLSDPTRTDTKVLARQLGAMLLDPMSTELRGVRRLLLSPDGALNLVPFAALRDPRQRTLLERHVLSYLNSGRELLRPRPKEPGTGPLLLAAPDFDAVPSPPSPRADLRISNASRTRAMRNAAIPWPFAPLPATQDEARAIQRLVPGMTVRTGAAANKAALHGARGPAIVHIATHGFFVDGRAEVGPPEIALLRSGLALAGANQPEDLAEDGILTALEVASLDLWGTQLVVLSACDTGVGSIHAGEGVYSLRRALSLAGSQSQVVSLWKVDDQATRELMTHYYRRLVRGEDRVEALRRIQLALMRRPAPFDHPYYWASFVIAGASGPVRFPRAGT